MGELIGMVREALEAEEALLEEAQIIPDLELVTVSDPSELARLLGVRN